MAEPTLRDVIASAVIGDRVCETPLQEAWTRAHADGIAATVIGPLAAPENRPALVAWLIETGVLRQPACERLGAKLVAVYDADAIQPVNRMFWESVNANIGTCRPLYVIGGTE